MSSSSFESQRSIRSSASLQSAASYRSGNDYHMLGFEILIKIMYGHSNAIRFNDYLNSYFYQPLQTARGGQSGLSPIFKLVV